MRVSEDDLAEILAYCRALADGADQLEAANRDRMAAIEGAMSAWRGPHCRQFAVRAEAELDEVAAVASRLRAEAAAWARAWADTVNEENHRRWQARVEAVTEPQWTAGRLADLTHGTSEVVRPFVAVPVPTAEAGFAPTGGLGWW